MVDFSEYLNFLEELEHTLQQLVDVEQKKSAAVSARDLDALNDCMKREQAFSMTLKGFEQKRARLLAALGLEDVSLRELPSRCPPEHREAARRMSERLINQYRILSSAQEPSRILMESRLRLIEALPEAPGDLLGAGGRIPADLSQGRESAAIDTEFHGNVSFRGCSTNMERDPGPGTWGSGQPGR